MAQSQDNARTLLEPHELAELGPAEAVGLPLDLVMPNPANPRQKLVEIPELAANIKEFGLLQSILVRRAGDHYEILGGHRRWAAYLLLAEQEPHDDRWRAISAIVRTADDERAKLMLISAQVHNRNWTTREEAAVLEELASTRTLREVGALINRGENWVGKRLRVYADSVLSGFVQSGKLPTSIAEELLLVPDAAQRREFAERAVSEAWGQVEARAAVRSLRFDKQLREIGRQARDLLALLSTVEPSRIPTETAVDLNALRRRIMALSRAPVIPSIEAAQKAAGVNPDRPVKQRRTRLRIE